MFLHPHALITQIPNWILLRWPKIFCTFNTWSFQSTFVKAHKYPRERNAQPMLLTTGGAEDRAQSSPDPRTSVNNRSVLERLAKSSQIQNCSSGKHRVNSNELWIKFKRKANEHSRNESETMLVFTTAPGQKRPSNSFMRTGALCSASYG